jgi:hypothetical protein
VKDDVEMLGVLPDELPPLEAVLLAEGELLPLLLQAARATPAVTASADVQLILVIKFKGFTSRFCGDRGREMRIYAFFRAGNRRGLCF